MTEEGDGNAVWPEEDRVAIGGRSFAGKCFSGTGADDQRRAGVGALREIEAAVFLASGRAFFPSSASVRNRLRRV